MEKGAGVERCGKFGIGSGVELSQIEVSFLAFIRVSFDLCRGWEANGCGWDDGIFGGSDRLGGLCS